MLGFFIISVSDPSILDWNDRSLRIIEEVKLYDCDILTFQEVHFEHFETFFVPNLRSLGYEGIYKKRTGDKLDGCAIFYKYEKVKLSNVHDCIYFVGFSNFESFLQINLIETLDVEYNQSQSPETLNRDNIGLLAKFAPKSSNNGQNCFCVATTHLLYNPRRMDVKLSQMMLILAELDRFSRRNLTNYWPVILTGDFNSSAESPIYDLLVHGNCNYQNVKMKYTYPGLINPNLGITDTCKHFCDIVRLENSLKLDQNATIVPVIAHPSFFGTGVLRQGYGFKSVYNPFVRPRVVTTRQNDYVMVDFIFYSRFFSSKFSKFIEGPLKLLGRLNLLTASECSKLGHLPNKSCPSDHLSLVAQFLLTNKQK